MTNGINDGIEISLVNTGLLQDNSITFTVGDMGTSTYNAQLMEYNLDDTVMLTSAVIDRPKDYTLSFKPNGSGVMKLVITSLTNASDVIGISNLYTTVITYTSQNITSTICNSGGDKYRFGFNGQEKVNEIAGTGNHNTALFWEYDTRLGRRWNLDPVDQISISNYAVNGLNPILMSDPNGDLFGIKGFGSTSEQRKSAREYAEKTGGKVNGLLKKSINVTYKKLELQPGRTYDDPNTAYGLTYDYVDKKQHFNQDGTLHDDRPQIKPYTPSLTDEWSENKSLVGSATYDLANGLYQLPQLFTQSFNGGFYNLNGSQAVRGSKEHLNSFYNGATFFVPAGEAKIGVGYLQKVNAAQFSKFFKGTTVASASPSIRGAMNKAFNNTVIKQWNDYIPTGSFLNDAIGTIPNAPSGDNK